MWGFFLFLTAKNLVELQSEGRVKLRKNPGVLVETAFGDCVEEVSDLKPDQPTPGGSPPAAPASAAPPGLQCEWDTMESSRN